MKKTGMFVVLLLVIFSAGCTSFFSNLQTPQKTLNLKDSAVFTQEKVKFTATVNSVTLNQNTAAPRQVSVRMTIKNTGTEAFSLIGYPKLIDVSGKEYPGSNIQFGSVLPGGMSSGTSTIQITTEEQYTALNSSAVLKVKFQSMTPLPYEGIWNVDLSK